MATKKQTEEIVEGKEIDLRPGTCEEGQYLARELPMEMVKVHLHKTENPEDRDYKDKFVCINGRTFQITRGVDAEVPYNVALVLQQSHEMLKFANKYARIK